MDLSWHSAVARSAPSSPVKWLAERNKVRPGPGTLDFGCGRGVDAEWFKWDKYDPHFFPEYPRKKYTCVVCIYVLNVVSLETEKKIIRQVRALLDKNGVAYFAVRRDAGMVLHRPSGYKQRYVKLGFPVLREHRQYCLYEMRR